VSGEPDWSAPLLRGFVPARPHQPCPQSQRLLSMASKKTIRKDYTQRKVAVLARKLGMPGNIGKSNKFSTDWRVFDGKPV